jgi:hypothetical protein
MANEISFAPDVMRTWPGVEVRAGFVEGTTWGNVASILTNFHAQFCECS